MAGKKILFQLEIQGSEVAIKNATDLKLAISEIEKTLKTTADDKAYQKLEQQALELKAALREVNAENQRTIRQFEAARTGEGSYVRLNQQLGEARERFRALSRAERESDIGKAALANIQALDRELKDIDASLGNFQRNVGNYPQQIGQVISQTVPGFGQLLNAVDLVRDGVAGLGKTATATGKLLVGAFIGLQVASFILDGVQSVKQFTDEIAKLRGELGRLSGETGPALDAATARVDALSNTFGEGTEEIGRAVSNTARAFGVDLNQALALVEQGFLQGANSQGEFLDQLREYPRLFQQLGFSTEQFIAIQVKAGQQGIYSDKGVDAVKEFGIRIREQTDATRTSLERAFGKEFTTKLFAGINDGSITVADALQRVSSKLRDTELPAKNLQEVISDVFGGPGEDAGDQFLKSLADIDQGLAGTAKATDEYTQRLQRQLDAEKELSAAKLETAKRLRDITGDTATLGKTIQTFGIGVFNKLLEAIKPAIDAYRNLGGQIIAFLQKIGLLSTEGTKANVVLTVIGNTLKLIFGAISLVVNSVSTLVGWIGDLAQRIPLLGSVLSALTFPVRALFDTLLNLPAVFAGLTEAGKQFVANLKARFEETAINLQILWTGLKRLNPFNSDAEDTAIDRELAALRSKRAEIQAAGRSVAEAFQAGYDSVNLKVLSAEATKAAAGKPKGKPTGNTDTRTAEQIAADKAAAKAADDRQKAALEAEKKYADERVELLKTLAGRLADATIQNIRDQTDRELAAENASFEAVKAELLKQSQEQEKAQLETRAKLVAGFGANSQQVKAFDAQALADFKAQRDLARQIEEQAETEHQNRIAAIKKAAADDQLRQQLERIQASLTSQDAELERGATLLATKLNSAINRVLNSNLSGQDKAELVVRLTVQADEANLQAEAAKVGQQIEQIEARLGELATSDSIEQASLEEYQFLVDQADALYLKRSELERAHTELVQREAERRTAARLEEYGKALEQTQQVVGLAGQFAAAIAAQDLQNIQDQEDARNASIDRIQEKLQTATGAEKAALEQRLKNEQDALKKLDAERNRLEKEEQRRAKAFAIIQAIITNALNVVKALGTPPVPNFGAAALTAGFGLGQIAVIAAQPAATGAQIGAGPLQPVEGLVSNRQNIPTQRNGDNVLAMLTRGEVVLNKKQQARLGGAPVFRAIGVPGFASGGVVDTTIAAPDLSGVLSVERIRQNEKMIELLAANVAATNSRLDRIKVFVTSDDIVNDQAEAAALRANATLE